jgi:hypothetical protein
MRFSFFIIFIFITFPAFAEYRAFLLKISGPGPDFRLVRASLDPIQYPYYHPVKPDQIVTYVDTWMCRGRTSYLQPVCGSPRDIASQSNQSLETQAPLK